MQKAMQLLEQRDKKLVDVARMVGYESDAAFSKAFKRVVGANPGEYLKRGFEGHGHLNGGSFLKRRIRLRPTLASISIYAKSPMREMK